MHARFVKTDYGWRCSHYWALVDSPMTWYKYAKVVFIDVKKAPPVGKFCKRPHHYL